MDIYDRDIAALESDEFTYEDIARLVDRSSNTIQGWAKKCGLSPHESRDPGLRRSVFNKTEVAIMLRRNRIRILV